MAGKPDKDAKPKGGKEDPKVDKRRKDPAKGKTCRKSLFDFCRKTARAPKDCIKHVCEETGCAEATVRTHVNKLYREGNLSREQSDGVGYLYKVASDAPMLAKSK